MLWLLACTIQQPFTNPFGNFTDLLITVVSQQPAAEYELETGTYKTR